jgi:glycosyltransferase involved in cell wall biosynthesis
MLGLLISMNAFYGWLSSDPPILYHTLSDELTRSLPPEPMTRLVQYAWHHSSTAIAEFHRRECSQRPQDTLHHCINELDVARQLIVQGIPASFINQNAFLDERIFDIQPDVPKQYEAVYNARMSSFKRHELAECVPRLLLIGGIVSPGDDEAYSKHIKATMPKATLLDTSNENWQSPAQIANHLNQCRVGLCLSACEGAMWAAAEYLFCGLPIVSTVSEGGRDVLFDPRYTRIVADDPIAIAQAVYDLIDLDISQSMVRCETLAKACEHRSRLFDLCQNIYTVKRVGRDFARDFYANAESKIGRWLPPADVMRHRYGWAN